MRADALMSKLGRQPAVARIWSNRALTIYATSSAGTPPLPDFDIRINDLDHIDRFEQTVSWLSRDEFVSAARKRIAGGGLVFTCADRAGPLLGYGYAHPDANETTYTHVGQRVIWPAHTGTIHGGFVHPSARGRAMHAALQAARVHHLVSTCGMRWVVSGVASDNAAALASVAKTELRPVARLSTQRRLGQVDMQAERIDPAFDAVFPDAHS